MPFAFLTCGFLSGMTSVSWTTKWLNLVRAALQRTAEAFPGFVPDFLLPMCGPNPDHPMFVAPMPRSQGILILRRLLKTASPDTSLVSIGAHSPKVTFLSWARQVGASEEARMAQGHHRAAGARLNVSLYGVTMYMKHSLFRRWLSIAYLRGSALWFPCYVEEPNLSQMLQSPYQLPQWRLMWKLQVWTVYQHWMISRIQTQAHPQRKRAGMMEPQNSLWLWYKPNPLTASSCSTHRRWSHMLQRAVNQMIQHALSKSKTVTWWRLFALPLTSQDQHWMVRLFLRKSFLRTTSCVCGHRAPKFPTERVQKGVSCW